MTNSRAPKAPLITVKTADVDRTSQTTVLADNELVIPVKANKSYSFIAYLAIKAHATPDFKNTFTGPSGSTGIWSVGALTVASPVTSQTFTTEFGQTCDDTKQLIVCHGTLKTASTAGSLSLLWAPVNNDANSCILLAGSSLIAYESK